MGGRVEWVLNLPVPQFNEIAARYRIIKNREVRVAGVTLQAAVAGVLSKENPLEKWLKNFPVDGGAAPSQQDDQDALQALYRR